MIEERLLELIFEIRDVINRYHRPLMIIILTVYHIISISIFKNVVPNSRPFGSASILTSSGAVWSREGLCDFCW